MSVAAPFGISLPSSFTTFCHGPVDGVWDRVGDAGIGVVANVPPTITFMGSSGEPCATPELCALQVAESALSSTSKSLETTEVLWASAVGVTKGACLGLSA